MIDDYGWLREQLSQLVCVDNFGDNVYSNLHGASDIYTWVSDTKLEHSYYPGVKGSRPVHKSYDTKIGPILFHESERNCNTCVNLERVKHPKCSAGWLTGRCKNIDHAKSVQLLEADDLIRYYPDDPMHMSCYVSRHQVQSTKHETQIMIALEKDKMTTFAERKQIVDEQTAKFWSFVRDAMDKLQEREEWIHDDCDYSDAGQAIPDSVIEFSRVFFEGLEKLIGAVGINGTA